jgi:Cap4 dsDNA endonuclease
VSDLGDPVVTAAGDDTGAETLQRYRYQASYAAWLAVGSLEEMPDVAAIYCEHHDDVLLELVGGVCDAIQIKTQASGVGPLKGNARPVLVALRRFVEFEHAFGDRFRSYRLASISGFHRSGAASSNLDHCLAQAQACSDPAAPGSPLVTLIKQIKAPAGIPPDIVVAALKKVRLDPTLPKLEDIEMRVRKAIEQLPETAHCRASDLLRAASAVIELAVRAGEATQGTAASDYVAYLADPQGHATRAAIEAKRLSPDTVRAAIHGAVAEATSLRSKEGSDVARLPSDAGTAHRKMDAGGLPVHTVGLLDDLRSSAEEEIERRLYRDGPDRTNTDYDHVQVLVRSIAEDARLAMRTPDSDYGQSMYAELRMRLRDQRTTDPESTRGLSVEQMTGVAAILTELCQVWWGDPFDLEVSA